MYIVGAYPINMLFIRLMGQSLSNNLAIMYTVGRNLASYLRNRSRKKHWPIGPKPN